LLLLLLLLLDLVIPITDAMWNVDADGADTDYAAYGDK